MDDRTGLKDKNDAPAGNDNGGNALMVRISYSLIMGSKAILPDLIEQPAEASKFPDTSISRRAPLCASRECSTLRVRESRSEMCPDAEPQHIKLLERFSFMILSSALTYLYHFTS